MHEEHEERRKNVDIDNVDIYEIWLTFGVTKNRPVGLEEDEVRIATMKSD